MKTFWGIRKVGDADTFELWQGWTKEDAIAAANKRGPEFEGHEFVDESVSSSKDADT